MNQFQKPFVSVIIPIYNAGQYLERCLEGLVNQTLQNIEIICVVDCPTDGSDQVVKNYAQKDSRIKAIYNKSNLYISESRNRGLEIATGEYIGFSDHDDWCEPDMYEELYKLAKSKNADCVISNSYIERGLETECHKYNDYSKEGIIQSLILPMWSSNNPNFLGKSVWASIYKRDIIECSNIKFPDKKMYHEEDTLFNLQFYFIAKTIAYQDTVYYHWIKHENATSDHSFSLVDRQVNYFKEIQKILIENNASKKYQGELSVLISTFIYAFLFDFKKLNKKQLSDLIMFNSLIKIKYIDKNYRFHQVYKKSLYPFYAFKLRLLLMKLTTF
jgi:glycosyltransferase involved in cell wall biosynthesis